MSKRRPRKSGSEARSSPRATPSLRRENAHFDGSRLYRQTREISEQVLAFFSEAERPFSKHIVAVNGGDRIVLATRIECEELTKRVDAYAAASASALDPHLFVPALTETASRYYYPGRSMPNESGPKELAPWLGTALKRCLAHLWPSLHRSPGTSRSIGRLIDAVGAAALADLLHQACMIFVMADGEIEVGPDGLTLAGDCVDAGKALFACFADRGRIFRTARACRQSSARRSITAHV